MKKLSFLILFIFAFTLTGCWDSLETEELGVVTIIGIKLGNTKNEIEVDIQMLSNKGRLNASGVPSAGTVEYYSYCANAYTINEALQKISAIQQLKLFLAHTKVIVVDEDFATTQGLDPVIDFCLRSSEMRITAKLLIAKHNNYKDIVGGKQSIDTGNMLTEKINNENSTSLSNVKNIKDIVEMIDLPTEASYTAGIELVPRSYFNSTYENEFLVKDIAVFKKNKMVGWIDDGYNVGTAYINEKAKESVFNVEYLGNEVALKIVSIKNRIKPKYVNNKMEINIMSDVVCYIVESHTNTNYVNDDNRYKVNELIDKKIKNEILSAINESKKLQADIFQFGEFINMDFHTYWNKVENKWDFYYPDLKVNVSVNSIIKTAGKVYKTKH